MNALSSFFSWFETDSASVAWAMVGGCVVAVGLAIEEIADILDERFLGGYRAHKTMRLFGWWMLMIGIWIEVADAGWTAHEIIKASPNNQPIGAVSAHAVVVIRPQGLNIVDNHLINLDGSYQLHNKFVIDEGNSPQSEDMFIELWLGKYLTIETNQFMSLLIRNGKLNSIIPTGNGTLRFDLSFDDLDANEENMIPLMPAQLDTVWVPLGTMFGSKEDSPYSALLNDLAMERLEVVTGDVTMTLNFSIKKDFFIPAQTNWRQYATSYNSNGIFIPWKVQ